MEIAGKIAVVTGASKGLGAAISEALVRKGATVYGLARNEAALKKLQTKIGKGFLPFAIDVSKEEFVESWVQHIFKETRGPDILINNAGAGYFGKIDELPLEQWRQMIDTNLNAVFYLTALIVPFMKNNPDSSHIITIGSILGKTSGSEKSGYSATKYGIQGFSEALFKELRGHNIKVSCVNPGSIDTHFFEASGIEPHKNMLQPSELAEVLLGLIETPDNLLIDELTVRPLNSRKD